MKNYAVIFDVDGVIFNWFGSFKDYVSGQGYKVVHDAKVNWDMTATFPELTMEQINDKVKEFNESEHFGHLSEMKGSYETLHRLRKKIIPDIPFAVITSAGAKPVTIRRRAAALEDFPIDEAWITPLGTSKKVWLENYRTGSVYVEDNLKHANVSGEIGHYTLLIDRQYNSDEEHSNVVRVEDWNEIESKIEDYAKVMGWYNG